MKRFMVSLARRRNLLVAVLLLPLAFASCPPGRRADRIRKLAQAADAFSMAVKSFQQAEITAHAQGLVDNAEHAAIERALIDVANAGRELDAAIRVAYAAGGRPQAQAAIAAALDSLDRLLAEGVLHVKNDNTRASLQALILAAKSFLAGIAAAFG